MGRSQVARNRAARGRGRGGRGGRGGGRDGGGGSRRHNRGAGADLSKLGSNDFRYNKSRSNDVADAARADDGGAYYDGLLDEIHVGGGSGLLGEYYGESHRAIGGGADENDLADATLSKNGADGAEDWMSIDVKALDKCLKRIPIHERLKLPRHIGRHLEDTYGAEGKEGGAHRKKTLAELREESKCIASGNYDDGSESESGRERGQPEEKGDALKPQPPEGTDELAADNDDEGDDLDAWLDDMIA